MTFIPVISPFRYDTFVPVITPFSYDIYTSD